jgi:branched-chain amino acid transport system substrate-binding protein
MKTRVTSMVGLTLVAAMTFGGVAPAAAKHEIVLGLQCDRTGAVQVVGVHLCPGYHDYVRLVNSKGGIEGHRIRALEIDHEYKVPQSIEAYERHKKEGAVVISLFGTPQTYALTQKLTEDRIPGTSPGFGRADAADGTRYPYLFPIAASYWSQAAASIKYARDQLGGLKGKKIAYLFFDNPAGREPIPVLEDLAEREAFQLRIFAVPLPGLEMGAQVLDIAQRYRADFVITHVAGRAPSVSIKELKRVGFPLRKVLAFVWGSAEADVEAAGGFAVAEGYNGLQYAGAGQDYPVLREIRDL